MRKIDGRLLEELSALHQGVLLIMGSEIDNLYVKFDKLEVRSEGGTIGHFVFNEETTWVDFVPVES